MELESTRDIDAKTLTIAQNELYSLGQKLTRVERELREKAQAETEFDIKYIALNEEKQKAIAAAEAKDEENTQLSRRKEHYKAVSNQLTQENEELGKRLTELEKVNTELRQKIADLESNVLTYQGQMRKIIP